MGPILILCYAYYHHYIVKHIVLVKKKKRERERYVCCSFLFVTGFTKLCFNKLLELLSSTLWCLCEFIVAHIQTVVENNLGHVLSTVYNFALHLHFHVNIGLLYSSSLLQY